MKNTTLKRAAPILAAMALLSFSQSSFAVSTWVFGDNTPTSECMASEVTAGTCAATTADPNAPLLKGFAVSSTGSGGVFAKTTLTSYSGGLGAEANSSDVGSPQHAIDNTGFTDAIVLNFGNMSFDLDKISIGWKGNSSGVNNGTGADADVSVFRYTGIETAPTPAGTALTKAALAADGWELIGNYADLSTSSAKSVNSTSKTSSWWLISAYNVNYGSSTGVDQGAANSGGTTGLQSGNDYFKLLSVAGTATVKSTPPQGVPEPGSLALIGLGLMGVVAVRRRKQSNT